MKVFAKSLKNIEIDCLPGPTAFVPALINSGISSDKFVFEGFLPKKKGRMSRIEFLKEEKRSIIIYESPHRIKRLIEELKAVFGGQRLVSISVSYTHLTLPTSDLV